jgi:DNA-binding CsgD family transcriptional regulator
MPDPITPTTPDDPLATPSRRGSPVRPPAAAGLPPLPGVLLAAALDEIDHGLLIVDAPSGRLRHANRQALVETEQGGMLTLADGLVTATAATAQRTWVAALQAAAGGRRSLVTLGEHRGGGDGLPDDGDLDGESRPRESDVTVAVVPLHGIDGQARQALAVFGRRPGADRLSVGFFSRRHGLTPTEDAVLAGLCRGLTPAEVAVLQGVALSTVRTHVNAIRLKTGVGSIRELVHKVSTLPPMAPAMRPGSS